jgi:hypothetical protein
MPTPSYPLQGSCNCGAVRYEVLEPIDKQAACHCIQCQKHTQSAFSLIGVVSPRTFRMLGGELKKWTKTADSGNRIDCWFCPVCGNRIYHENQDMPGVLRLKLGTLDDTSVIDPGVHVWVSKKQNWLDLPSGVQTFDTQPDLKELLKS